MGPRVGSSSMKHLPVSAPSFAVLLGGLLMLFNAPWWLILAAFLLGAPLFVAVFYVIDTHMRSCEGPRKPSLGKAPHSNAQDGA